MTLDTQAYKEQLETALSELTAELKTIGVHDPKNKKNWVETAIDLDTVSADLNDVADRAEELGERRATVAVLEARYNNLERALQKIEDGTYGVCEIEGGEIDQDRLDANPAARTCKVHMNDENNLPS